MYHVSVLPPKQHKIPLIVSRQISITNVSSNLTGVHLPYGSMLQWFGPIFFICSRNLEQSRVDSSIQRNLPYGPILQ